MGRTGQHHFLWKIRVLILRYVSSIFRMNDVEYHYKHILLKLYFDSKKIWQYLFCLWSKSSVNNFNNLQFSFLFKAYIFWYDTCTCDLHIFFLNNQMIGKSRRIVQNWKGKLAIKFQLTIKVYINLNGNDYRIKTFPPVTMPVNSTEESVALDGFQREGGGDEVGHAVFTRTDEISVSSPDPESANTVSVSYWILLTMGILKNTLQSTGTWLINFSYS